MTYKTYHSHRPDLDLVKTDALSYILSNPRHTAPDKPIFVDPATDQFRTFSDVQQRTKSLAYGLKRLGVKSKDVVAFMSPNSIDYAITCYAILGCGAIVSPVSAAANSSELNAQLVTSTARFLIVHSSMVNTADQALAGSKVEKVIQADGSTYKHGNETAEKLAELSPVGDLVSIDSCALKTQLAFLCFSSGTTGRAKGVMTSHANITSNMQQWTDHMPEDFTGSGISVGFLPFSHIYGLMYFCCLSVFSGATVIVMPKFELHAYLDCIQRYRPESLVLVPPVALRIAKDAMVSKFDLSSVKRIMSAAAPLSPELRRATEAKFRQLYNTDVFVYQGYGATETTPIATGVSQSRPDKKDTVGNLARNITARIVDPETLRDVKTGEAGEIWVRGPNICLGYYNDPAATNEAFVTDNQGSHWYRTGDIGTVDADGFFTVVDRIKEMIKYKGLQVVPSELEGKLLEHPLVTDSCVVGQGVEGKATELPVAFVVLALEAAGIPRDQVVAGIHEFVRERVADHKRLRGGVVVVDVIPKSASGKILRRELKSRLSNAEAPKPKI